VTFYLLGILMEYKLPAFYRTKCFADYASEVWPTHCWTFCIF